jgi:hypothetical protein
MLLGIQLARFSQRVLVHSARPNPQRSKVFLESGDVQKLSNQQGNENDDNFLFIKRLI